ncbi:MAG: DUF3866 family protein [Epulopiscium sp.]|nr:DUF3866 family protein [Candidatus Epulonipiscium sp.]
MIHLREGIVTQILEKNDDVIEILVTINELEYKAIVYPKITGDVSIGDVVKLNTTAIDLNLGTGGYHFVISNKSTYALHSDVSGHIMKLRYTPIQMKCLTIEEIYPQIINSFKSLEGMPVAIGSIHSMLPPLAAVIKEIMPDSRIAYIMTDGGALPIGFSHIVRILKEKTLIDCTFTCGNAFGGDFEAVNLYTALIGAKFIAGCDAAIVIMGPGHVGTGTKLGFTGMEIVNNAHIVHSMGGIPICVPRVSFSEKRKRHYGISHHFLTAMGSYCLIPCHMAFPCLSEHEMEFIIKQYKTFRLDKKHKISFLNEDTIYIMEKNNLFIKTMGRSILEDSAFFRTSGACGVLLTNLLS